MLFAAPIDPKNNRIISLTPKIRQLSFLLAISLLILPGCGGSNNGGTTPTGSPISPTPSNNVIPSTTGPKETATPSGLTPSVQLSGYQLAWQDEFNGNSLDTGKWSIDTGKRKGATNCAEALNVSNGLLTITTFTESGVHKTGFIKTAGKYEPVYGFFEARIRFNTTSGEWGAFWLQSDRMGTQLGNPDLCGAEIDIVEHRAYNQGNKNNLENQIMSTIHWDGYGTSHKNDTYTHSLGSSLNGQWHVFAVLWTDQGYSFYIDGQQYWTTSQGLSKYKEHILLTCEVMDNSNDWVGNIPANGFGSLSTSSTRMEVDWVRVWQKP